MNKNNKRLEAKVLAISYLNIIPTGFYAQATASWSFRYRPRITANPDDVRFKHLAMRPAVSFEVVRKSWQLDHVLQQKSKDSLE